MKWFLLGTAALHAGFMLSELFPWLFPLLLNVLTTKLLSGEAWSGSQQAVVATIIVRTRQS